MYLLASSGSGFVILLIFLGAYLAPSIIAVARKHHQLAPIIVINIFLGWTVIGWVVALAMSVSETGGRSVFDRQPSVSDSAMPPLVSSRDPRQGLDDIPKLFEELSELHAAGILTDEEFAAKKAELLGRL